MLRLCASVRRAFSTLRYTQDHEWVKLEADGLARIGITDYAQKALGDLVYVEMPKLGTQVKAQRIFFYLTCY